MSVTIDVGAVIKEIRETVLAIQSNLKTAKEQNEAAQLIVYRALSIHPAIAHMRPPTDVLADLDWYTELRAPVLSAAFFGSLGKNEHFKRLAKLGETGTRARIMLLLCWVIGHRLPKDRVEQLLSTALHDALGHADAAALMDGIQRHAAVQKVVGDLAKMVKTRLPLPTSYNPFYGPDFVAADEDKALPRAELWAYELPEDQRYEFDVKRNSTVLLRGIPGRVLIPTTKLSLLCILWLSRNFGLGHKVYSASDIVADAFWNADPPPSSTQKDLSGLSDAIGGTSLPATSHLGDALRLLPMEDWVHERFCHIYPVHQWIHDPILRALLLNSFASDPRLEALPSLDRVVEMSKISACLRPRLLPDVWEAVVVYVSASALEMIARHPLGDQPTQIGTRLMSDTQKCMPVIFADAARMIWTTQHLMQVCQAFGEFFVFLIAPHILYPADPKISRIPLIKSVASEMVNRLPPVDPDACTCGQCVALSENAWTRGKFFIDQYDSLISSSDPTKCSALSDTWELAMQDAEEWLDSVMGRCISSIDLLPKRRRLGPLVLDLLNVMGIPLGSDLDTSSLLRFLTALRYYNTHHLPDSLAVPLPPSEDLIGYMSAIGYFPEFTDYDFGDLPPTRVQVLSTAGGWLSQMPDSGLEQTETTVSFLFPLPDELRITPMDGAGPMLIAAIYMPRLPPDVPILTIPAPHVATDIDDAVPLRELPEVDGADIQLHVSFLPAPGYPDPAEAAMLDTGSETELVESKVAQLVACVSGRLIQSWWQPRVIAGRACQHAGRHRQLDRCSFSCADILLQVRYPDPDFLRRTAWFRSTPVRKRSMEGVPEYFEALVSEHKRRTTRLTERHGLFEAQRMTFVRCHDVDESVIDAVVVLAGSLGKRVYIVHAKECADCAIDAMRDNGCTVGIFTVLERFSSCAVCNAQRERAQDIAQNNEELVHMTAEGKEMTERMLELTMEGFGYVGELVSHAI
ncbi:hypothetical protein WOLCODRAFT_150373 [Wolfiporia cocos MD-104 SS10]|uniref:Uncharacterized protein n=1 Tax=Wolfiporia cocos (strain MD-104) TaxID=742152 RepID=A0A2H3JKE7_WOLCO|nr:hypothetical protein WOLCODRAFT_150373 [Wolfiporia cocos MD-104 SS10]